MKRSVYKNYVLFLLLAAYTLNFIDRQILALLMEPIKQDLALSDTQLGLLSGLAFAVLYCVMGIPIARWADYGNRVTIIALAIAIWSLMTAFCGLATGFIFLLLCRIGVGVGEAGCTPPAHSLIADYFEKPERPRAYATYMMGTSLAVLIGYSLGGWLNEFYGWRVAFFVLGAPGILLALIVKISIREPRERKKPIAAAPPISIRDSMLALWRKKTLRNLVAALSIVNFLSFGIGTWFAAFFIRTHGMSTGELGTWLALVGGFSGLFGTWLGGRLATSRFLVNKERLQMNGLALAQLVILALQVVIILSPYPYLSLILIGVGSVIGALSYGPSYALLQSLVEERVRAMAVAVGFFVMNLIGMGFGPQFIGILSDMLQPTLGDESLRWAMVASLPVLVWAAYQYWRAGLTAEEELEQMTAADHSRNDASAQPTSSEMSEGVYS